MARAGGMCELCETRVLEDSKLMGEVAHIRGHKPDSARYDRNMSESERESPENLILLCPNCHTRIDKLPEKYTVEHLLDKRDRHRNKLELVSRGMPDIEFPELDEAVQ